MPFFRSRDGNARAGPARTTAQFVEWGALVARFAEVVSCCDCWTCRRAEALAAARRLRALTECASSFRTST